MVEALDHLCSFPQNDIERYWSRYCELTSKSMQEDLINRLLHNVDHHAGEYIFMRLSS